MKTGILATTCALLATASFAATTDAIDTDGDGVVSFVEMSAAYPDLTEDIFNAVDTNGDGVVDAEELAAGEQGGLVPAKSG
ncbi:MAG: EF-hand domain-containing protein [Litoreibacter sp.]|nr:EF-hand domain-containing protein [Litoreibacter sp.]